MGHTNQTVGVYEIASIDDILHEGHGKFAQAVAFEYLQRLISVIDPKSQVMARICGFFEEGKYFYNVDRNDFPAKRAAHNAKIAAFNKSLRPLEEELSNAKKDLKALREKRVAADRQDRKQLNKQIHAAEVRIYNAEGAVALALVKRPKGYKPHYVKNGKGLFPRANAKDVEQLKEVIKREAATRKKLMQHPVFKNLNELARLFKWPRVECDLVDFLWSFHNCEDFKKLISDGLLRGVQGKEQSLYHLIAVFLGTDRPTISRALANESELMLSGVLMPPKGSDALLPGFTGSLIKMLDQPDIVLETMLQSLIGEPAATHLDLHVNFNYVADHIPHVKLLVDNSIKQGKPGYNIIVYGLQDSGKTEFTKALAQSLGLPLFMLGETKNGHAEPTAAERLSQVLLAKRLTKHMKGVILAVDEAEDLLKILEPGAEKGSSGVTKVYLNRLLERGHMTVWIVNDIKTIDPAVRRRFKYSINFGALTARDRLHVWKDLAKKYGLPLPDSDLADLATKYQVPVGSIVTAFENAVMTTKDVPALHRSLRATGNFVFNGLPAILSGESSKMPYYPELQNFKELRYGQTPGEFCEKIIKHVDRPIAVLAYGPSGAGKKAFFRDIARESNREFLNYNFVELFQSEELLGHVLQEAMNKPSIIAWDGMAAINGFESHHPVVGAVRERIRQLTELMPCVHVFCSNVKDKPPQWAKQEFAFILEYEHLMKEQIKIACEKFFGFDLPISKINKLTPGNFSTIVHRNRGLLENLPKDEIRRGLDEISSLPAVQPAPIPGSGSKPSFN